MQMRLGCILIVLLAGKSVMATDRIANSCAQNGTINDVQAAANLLQNGDRLVIPACSPNPAAWTSPVSIPTNVVGFTITGASQTTTVISSGTPLLSSLFIINPTSAGVVRITNMGFVGTLDSQSGLGFIALDGVYTSFRIDHVTISSAGNRVVSIGYNNYVNDLNFTPIYGLIDHITYTSDSTCAGNHGFGIYFGGQLNNWQAADNFGTSSAVYIEDSTFDFSPGNANSECIPMDTEAGGRVVIRHNTIKDGQFNVHDFQNGPSLGSRIQEWYSNTFQCLSHSDCGASAMAFRGGSYIAFDNIIPRCNQLSRCITDPKGYEDATATEIWRLDTYQPNIVQACDFQPGVQTLTIAAGGAVRTGGNMVTITTTVPHNLAQQQVVSIAGITDQTNFPDASVTIASVPTTLNPTTFTYTQNGANVTSGGGTVTQRQQLVASDLRPHCEGGTNPWCGQNEDVNAPCSVTTCPQGGCGVCRNYVTGTPGTQGTAGAGNVVLAFVDGTSSSGGYPALMQTARGQYNSASSPRNALSPMYLWNIAQPSSGTDNPNALYTTVNVAPGDGGPNCLASSASCFLAPNRDFYITDNTNCPAGGASCTAGVGRGPIAQRPGTCTPGVGYFATDTDPTIGPALYVCTPNGWPTASYYKPYTYPHPLQN